MSVKCLAIGDPHFMTSNVTESKDLIKKVNLLTDQLNPDFVVLLGDLLHTHEKIHVTPLTLATQFITDLSKKTHVYLIIGNHDYCLGGNVEIKMWDGSIKFARDIKQDDEILGDDFTHRLVKSTVCGNSNMYTIKQYNETTDEFVSEYTASINHTLVLYLQKNICYWDKNKNEYDYYWVEKNKLCNIKSASKQYINNLMKTTPFGPYFLNITVKEFLLLEPRVSNKLRGYRRNCNIQVPVHFYHLRNPHFFTELLKLKITNSNETEYFGWELYGNEKNFLLGDNTVTHNCNNQQFLTDAHAFNAFKNVANVTVCDKPIVSIIKEHKFVYCPYVPPKRFEEALDTLGDIGERWDDATCIFAHQEFYGSSFNPVANSTEGDNWPNDYPLVVSGHIHNEQKLQSNIYYPGSSMQHAFGESSNKIVALLTFNKGEKFKLQRIDLEMRKKKIVYINITNIDKFKPEPNVNTKLVVKGTAEQFKVFRKSQVYKDLQKLGIAISFAPIENKVYNGEKNEKKNIIVILKELIKNENERVQNAFAELIK